MNGSTFILSPRSGPWGTNHMSDSLVKFTMLLQLKRNKHIACLKGPFLQFNIMISVYICSKDRKLSEIFLWNCRIVLSKVIQYNVNIATC